MSSARPAGTGSDETRSASARPASADSAAEQAGDEATVRAEVCHSRASRLPPRPLDGFRVLDLGGIGPGPFAAMVLADMGAEVIRVHRPREAIAAAGAARGEGPGGEDVPAAEGVAEGVVDHQQRPVDVPAAEGAAGPRAAEESATGPGRGGRGGAGPGRTEIDPVNPVLDRGKCSLVLDLRSDAGRKATRRLVSTADAVIEGFRPGVAERMGLGPADLFDVRPDLVYGRITGWGQTGPDAGRAGHDMNYIAGSGLLSQLGRGGEAPRFPANLAADFGGGGMQLALGVVAALLRVRTTGSGCVVDATMADGANQLWAMQFGFEAMGLWREGRGQNLLDSGAPFYDVYATSDGGYVSVGCIEPQFFEEFVGRLQIADRLPAMAPGEHRRPEHWAALRAVFTEALGARTRAELAELFEDSDACTVVVRSWAEAEAAVHNQERGLFYRDENEVRQPAPAPRFADPGAAAWAGGRAVDGTEAQRGSPAGEGATVPGGSNEADADEVWGHGEPYVRPGRAPRVGEHTDEVLASAGFTAEEISGLRESGVLG